MAVEVSGKLLQTNEFSSTETIRMSLDRMSANATSLSSQSRLLSSVSLYYVTDDMGYSERCVGPTPPPGLAFPIMTVVEKLVEADGPTTEMVFVSRSSYRPWITSTFTAPATSYSTWTTQMKHQLNQSDDYRPCCGMCTVYVSLVDVY